MREQKIVVCKEASIKPCKGLSSRLVSCPKSTEIIKNIEEVKNDLSYLGLVEQVIYLAKLFKVSVSYQQQTPKDRCKANCNLRLNHITIFKNSRTKSREIKVSLLHEIAHIIQYREGLLDLENTILSKEVFMEQQAQVIAFKLSQIFFKRERFVKKDFFKYFHKEHFKSLYEFYTKTSFPMHNDLFKIIWVERKKKILL